MGNMTLFSINFLVCFRRENCNSGRRTIALIFCMYVYIVCILLDVASCTLGQYCDRWKVKAGTMPYVYFELLQEWFFIVHSTIDSTVHSMYLNSLEHNHDDKISCPTGIRAWYPWYLNATRPGRYDTLCLEPLRPLIIYCALFLGLTLAQLH